MSIQRRVYESPLQEILQSMLTTHSVTGAIYVMVGVVAEREKMALLGRDPYLIKIIISIIQILETIEHL